MSSSSTRSRTTNPFGTSRSGAEHTRHRGCGRYSGNWPCPAHCMSPAVSCHVAVRLSITTLRTTSRRVYTRDDSSGIWVLADQAFRLDGWIGRRRDPEGRPALARAAALMVTDKVDDHAIEPQTKLFGDMRRPPVLHGAQECLLNDVLRRFAVSNQPHRQLKRRSGQVSDHRFDPRLASLLGLAGQFLPLQRPRWRKRLRADPASVPGAIIKALAQPEQSP